MPNYKNCSACTNKIKLAQPPACKRCGCLFHLECVLTGVVLSESKALVMCNSCLKKDYIDKYAKIWNYDEIQANYNKALSEIAECKLLLAQTTELINERKREFSDLNDKIDALIIKFNQLNSVDLDKQTIKQDILHEISVSRTTNDDHILQLIKEERLREKKRLNLCIRGFPCNEAVDDLVALRQLCSEQLNISSNDALKITSCRRIPAGSNSLLIATVENFDTKKLILRNAYKLKNFKSALNRPIYIAPDLTKSEQAKAAELRKELVARRQNGENVYIKKNKIVTRELPVVIGRRLRSRTVAQQQQTDANLPTPVQPPSPCPSTASSTPTSTPSPLAPTV